MNVKQWTILIFCTSLALLSANSGSAQDDKENVVGHAVYGQMTIPAANSDPEEGDTDVIIFGADAQKPFYGKIFQLGIETGAFFSWDSTARHVSVSSGSGGGTATIAVEVNSFMMDYFGGGFLGFEPTKWLRLYAGAGPLLIWGTRATDPEESDSDEYSAESTIEFGAGIYARAGLDIFLSEQFGLTLGVRQTETTLNFKDATGEIDIGGTQYYLGLAFRF